MDIAQTHQLTVEERRQKVASLRALIEQKISESYKQQRT